MTPLGQDERDLDRKVLASERTAMAWGRTALALGAVAGVAVHAAGELGTEPAGYGFAALLLGAAGVVALHGARRYLAIQRGDLPRWQIDPRATQMITAATTLIALVAALLTVLA